MSRGPDSVEHRLAEYRRRRRTPEPVPVAGAGQPEGPSGAPSAGVAGPGSWLRRLVPSWGRHAARGDEEKSGGGEALGGGRGGDGGVDGGVHGGGDVGDGERGPPPPRRTPWLRVSLWLLLLGLFFQLQLLTPFLLVSVLVFLPLASSSRRARGALSAYSVFNPGCRALPGAISTEQLEREMGYGAL